MCSACIALKKKYDKDGVEYIERDGNRLSTPDGRKDQVDVDAFVQLNMQNMVFPVEVEVALPNEGEDFTNDVLDDMENQ